MDKEELRKEFFKLKYKGFSYAKCKVLLAGQYEYKVSVRTLQRWQERLQQGIRYLRKSISGYDICHGPAHVI